MSCWEEDRGISFFHQALGNRKIPFLSESQGKEPASWGSSFRGAQFGEAFGKAHGEVLKGRASITCRKGGKFYSGIENLSKRDVKAP